MAATTIDCADRPVREINRAMEGGGQAADDFGMPAPSIHVDTSSLAQAAFADAANTARVGNIYFGPLPDSLAVLWKDLEEWCGSAGPHDDITALATEFTGLLS